MSEEFEKAELVPDAVGDYIDQELLPDLANGYNSAKSIATQAQLQARESLEEYFETHDRLCTDKSVIWAWLEQGKALDLVEDYVNRAFFLWGEA